MAKAIHYRDLVERYGPVMAYDLLLQTEKLARIRDRIGELTMTEDDRLQRAFDIIEGKATPETRAASQ